MKKIAVLGIAVGVVLAAGLIANIGLFSNNALAAQPSMEQRIKTIFWMITNPEFGLKEIKREVKNIEEKVMLIGTLQSFTASTTDFDQGDEATLTCTAPFEVTAINVDIDGITDFLDRIDLTYDPDGVSPDWDPINFVDFFGGPAFDSELLLGKPIAGLAGGTVSLLYVVEAVDDGEVFRVQFVVRSSGTCTASIA